MVVFKRPERRRAGILVTERRMGTEGSATWSLLLDTAEKLMRDKGYPAVTSRQLGKEAGLSPQIVYFYFRTMDDVFEAVFRRLAASLLTALDKAALADEPMLAMWKVSCDPSHSPLMMEIISLANHRVGLRNHIEEFGREYNIRQVAIIDKALAGDESGLLPIPTSAIASILENLARSFSFSQNFDIASHNLAQKLVTEFIRKRFGKA